MRYLERLRGVAGPHTAKLTDMSSGEAVVSRYLGSGEANR